MTSIAGCRLQEKMVEDGAYPTVSSVIEAGLKRMMCGDDLADPLAGKTDETKRRMELPREQWFSWDRNGIAGRVKQKPKAKYET